MTDTEMIDFLEELNGKAEFTGLCVLRDSTTGRGWRLHECGPEWDGFPTVREAIEKFKAERDQENGTNS